MTRRDIIAILEDLWRYSKSERYTDKEIRKAIDKAIHIIADTASVYKIAFDSADLMYKDRIRRFTDAVNHARLIDLDDPTSTVTRLISEYLKGETDDEE